MERLTDVVRKTRVINRNGAKTFLARAKEERLRKFFKDYEEGGAIYPDGNGGTRLFTKEQRKPLYASKIYAEILWLATNGATEKAIKYAQRFDRELTIKDVHLDEIYV
jgi:hypothetical protein